MKKSFLAFTVVCFFVTSIVGPDPIFAQDFRLPAPGVMVHLSPPLDPPILKGIKVHPDNSFRFDFILDKGDESTPHPERSEISQQEQLKIEATKLIKYFLVSLTIPEKDLWVNLSPYEKDRIIPNSFGLTEMGRDLLAEDYMLKQITASLIYPEDEIGKKFWKRIYEEAAKKYGTTNIPVNTFNKVWIVPEKAVVYENAKAGTAYVVESRLKVMLEQDYLSMQKHFVILSEGPHAGHSLVAPKDLNKISSLGDFSASHQNDINALGSQIIREIVIPELTKEVNEGKNFARLRQVYNSLILATWYKKKIKDSILEQVYADKNKVAGVNIDDPQEKQRIYERYLRAFKRGVFNFIKEDVDPASQETIPRKYFSGGFDFAQLTEGFGEGIAPVFRTTQDPSLVKNPDSAMQVKVRIDTAIDKAQLSIKKILKRTSLAAVIAMAVGAGGLFGYGKYLLSTGYLNNNAPITQQMSNVQILLDPQSEDILSKFIMYVGDDSTSIAKSKAEMEEWLLRFSVDKRHEILKSLDSVFKGNRTGTAVGDHGLEYYLDMHKSNNWNIVDLIDFLEFGDLFHYDGTVRVPSTIIYSPDQAKELWKAYSGKEYNLSEIIIDGLQDTGPFNIQKMDTNGNYSSSMGISSLILSLAQTKLPFQVKIQYLNQLRAEDFFTVVSVDVIEKMYTEINKIEDSFWLNEEHKKRAMIFISNYYEESRESLAVHDKIIDFYGGWQEVLTKMSHDTTLSKKIVERQERLNMLLIDLGGMEGNKNVPQFIMNWKYDQIEEFHKNLDYLRTQEKSDGEDIAKFFTNYDKLDLPISPDLPLKLISPDDRKILLGDNLDHWPLLNNGAIEIKTKADYQALEVYWEMLLSLNDENIINDKIKTISISDPNWKDLAYMAKHSEKVSTLFSSRMIDEFRPIYKALELISVKNYSDFIDVVNGLDFLKQMYSIDQNAYPKYLEFAKKLAGSQTNFEDFIPKLNEDDYEGFLSFVNFVNQDDPAKAQKLVAIFIQTRFADFVQTDKMKNLSQLEESRVRLNDLSTVLGDQFIITIAQNFINSHPVTEGNIKDLLEVAKVWRYQAPTEGNRDVQALYKLGGYFIANNINDFLKTHQVEGKVEILEELKGLGIINYEEDNSRGFKSQLDKLAVNTALLNYDYLGNKIISRLTRKQESENIELHNNDSFKLPQSYVTMDVDLDGKNIGYLFVGDPFKGAKVAMGFDVGYEHGGMSAKKFAELNPDVKLVMDFPLGFTTGNGKPTDIAIEKGEVKNWLMSLDRADGLVMVYANGQIKITDKRNLHVKDLYVNQADNKYGERVLDLKKMNDYVLFINIAKSQKLSVMANILLINHDEQALIQDNKDSRRLLLEFSDGRTGLLNMNVPVTTAEATQAAAAIRLSNRAKVVWAVYCDTGYYDYFTVHSGNGDKVLGHSDKPDSSNRVFFYQSDQAMISKTDLRRMAMAVALLPFLGVLSQDQRIDEKSGLKNFIEYIESGRPNIPSVDYFQMYSRIVDMSKSEIEDPSINNIDVADFLQDLMDSDEEQNEESSNVIKRISESDRQILISKIGKMVSDFFLHKMTDLLDESKANPKSLSDLNDRIVENLGTIERVLAKHPRIIENDESLVDIVLDLAEGRIQIPDTVPRGTYMHEDPESEAKDTILRFKNPVILDRLASSILTINKIYGLSMADFIDTIHFADQVIRPIDNGNYEGTPAYQKALRFFESKEFYDKGIKLIKNGKGESLLFLLFTYHGDEFMDEFFNVNQIKSISPDQFDLILTITSKLGTSMDRKLLDRYQERIVDYFRTTVSGLTYHDIVKVLGIYNAISAANTEWVGSIEQETKRILNEGFENLPAEIDVSNFIEIAKIFSLYERMNKISSLNVPQADEYLKNLIERSTVNEEFVKRLNFTNIQELALALDFVKNLPNANNLFSLLVQGQGASIFQFSDLKGMEVIRKQLNVINPTLGDGLLIAIGSNYINDHFSLDNLSPKVLEERFAGAQQFYNPKEGNINRDIKGLYQLIGNFMLSRVADYMEAKSSSIKAGIGKDKFNGISSWLVEHGFIAENDPWWLKIYKDIKNGNVSYLTHKITSTTSNYMGSSDLGIDSIKTNVAADFPMEVGAQALEIKSRKDNMQLGFLFKFDPQKGGRLKFMVDVGRQAGGITGEKLIASIGEKGRLVMDAPLSFTTGDAKPTEIIIQDGVIKNYLISTKGKDALIIVYKDGNVHVADKRELWIHDINPNVAKQDDRKLDITQRIEDYKLFLDVSQQEKISLVSNMLLYDGVNATYLNDGKDQRRLFVMFRDGQFGILNPMVGMTTAEATRLAIELGAVKAVYMDTGMFDYTTIRPIGQAAVVLGHSDQNASSNRIGAYVLHYEPNFKWSNVQPKGKIFIDPHISNGSREESGRRKGDHAQIARHKKFGINAPGGIDLTHANIHLQTQNAGEAIKFHLNPAQLAQLQKAPGFVPVIINIQPLKSLSVFLGLNKEPVYQNIR